ANKCSERHATRDMTSLPVPSLQFKSTSGLWTGAPKETPPPDMEFNDTVMSERADHPPVTTEAELRRFVTFHCRKCHTVLGDSFGVCGELGRLDSNHVSA
ncbi:unnamed protein product, partial [Lampetra planeri]